MSLIFAGEKQLQSCLGSDFEVMFTAQPHLLHVAAEREKKKSFFTFILRLLNVVAQIMLVTYRFVL